MPRATLPPGTVSGYTGQQVNLTGLLSAKATDTLPRPPEASLTGAFGGSSGHGALLAGTS